MREKKPSVPPSSLPPPPFLLPPNLDPQISFVPACGAGCALDDGDVSMESLQEKHAQIHIYTRIAHTAPAETLLLPGRKKKKVAEPLAAEGVRVREVLVTVIPGGRVYVLGGEERKG